MRKLRSTERNFAHGRKNPKHGSKRKRWQRTMRRLNPTQHRRADVVGDETYRFVRSHTDRNWPQKDRKSRLIKKINKTFKNPERARVVLDEETQIDDAGDRLVVVQHRRRQNVACSQTLHDDFNRVVDVLRATQQTQRANARQNQTSTRQQQKQKQHLQQSTNLDRWRQSWRNRLREKTLTVGSTYLFGSWRCVVTTMIEIVQHRRTGTAIRQQNANRVFQGIKIQQTKQPPR